MQISRRAPKPHAQIYEKYTIKLIVFLPMDNTRFIAKLSANGLLHGNTSDQLKALRAPTTKASYFLGHVIKPALDMDDTSSFDNLLSVMEHCGYDRVEKLACEIISEIEEGMNLSHQYAKVEYLLEVSLS